MASKSKLERTRGEVPDLDCAIAGARDKPLVPWLNGQCANPAEMAGDDAHELPRGVPFWFWLPDHVPTDEAGGWECTLRGRPICIRW